MAKTSYLKNILLAVFLSVAILAGGIAFSACGGDAKDEGEVTNYNVIMTESSIPPVLAALAAIKSEDATYAWAQRGKTYQGIAQLDNFEPISTMNPNSNRNAEDHLNATDANGIKEAVQAIVDEDENAFVTFYCVDFNGFAAYTIAIQAGLDLNKFHIVMIEDGAGAYAKLYSNYVSGMADADAADANFDAKVAECQEDLDAINENPTTASNFRADGNLPIALATFDNFSYVLQSKASVKAELDRNANIAGSKLYDVLGVNQGATQTDFIYQSISEGVAQLSAAQKQSYLDLMLSTDRSKIVEFLTRTSVGETQVPTQKLVFIGDRVMGSDKGYVTDMNSLSDLPENYADLGANWKAVFNDATFYNEVRTLVLSDTTVSANASGVTATAEQKDAAKVAAVNKLMEYMFGLQTTYALYGDEYDILYKGHPSEVVDPQRNTFDTRYHVGEGDAQVNYNELMWKLIVKFYQADPTGKMIGFMPSAFAAENLAYVGVDFVLGGMQSSTYQGYEKDVMIEFVFTGDNTTVQTYNVLSGRLAEDSLTWTKGDDENYTLLYLNRGNTYKALAEYYAANDQEELAAAYTTLMKNWMIGTSEAVTEENVDNYTIDRYGNIVAVEIQAEQEL